MIRARLNKWLVGLMVAGFALLAGGLVTYDILRRFEWHLPSFLIDGLTDHDAPAPRQDEIRKYVQFAEVRYGANKVVTGVERASDRDRQISSQWCYVTGPISNGNWVQLTLANKNRSGALSVPKFSQTALADFELTRAQARALVTSHCRFQ